MESQDPPTYTLDEALSSVGFGRFQGFALAYAGFGWIAESMEIMILSFIGNAVKSEWNLSSDQESLITSIVFTGMLLGAYSWGLVSDNFGRKTALFGICVITAVAGSMSALCRNYVSLIVVRWLVGVGLGGGHIFTTWFLEFVPTPNRGAWMIVFSSFWTVGTIFEASLAWIVMPRLGWRWLLALSSIPTLLLLIFFVLVPETPHYFIMKGRIQEASTILEKLAHFNRSRLPPGQLVPNHIEDQDKDLLSSSSHTNLDPKRKKLIVLRDCLIPKFVLVSSKYIRTTILLWLLYFGYTFVYYGVVLLTSKLSSGQNQCRGNADLHPTTAKDDNKLYFNVFVTTLAEFPGLVIAAIILDRLGRKYTMEIMLAFGFALLLPLAWHQSQIITTGLLFGARMFVSATFIVACIYAPEVYPTNVRSSGVGVATAIGRIGGIVCPMVAITLVNNCHLMAAVLMFEAAIVLLVTCVVLLPFETMGKELKDGQEM